VESIEELKKICQGTVRQDVSNIYMRYVCRPLSIRITRLILPTQVTADQVSQAMIVAGLLAALVLSLPWRGTFFVGAVLLQLWYLIDCMDGEVARYRYYQKTGKISIDKRDTSLTGMYYDMINHYLMNFLVPAAVAFGEFVKTGSVVVLWLGSAASLGQVMLLAMHDARSRAVLSHLKKYKNIQVTSQEKKVEVNSKELKSAKWVFSSLHYIMTYPSVMNLVLLTAVFALAVPRMDWRGILTVVLAIGSLAVASVLVIRAIQRRDPDREFSTQFSVSDDLPTV